MSKHFINSKETLVQDAIDGMLAAAEPGKLARLDGYPDIKIVVRADWDKSRVAVISGGGSGHEPSHAGFVGKAMLTAAVCGEVFASPSVDAVLSAIRAVTGPSGCLLVVKNYTGDRLNFGLAAERARAEGFDVEMVIVADDVALPDINQPRGVAGTLFVHKIAGYLAESGAPLADVAAAAKAASQSIVSLGVSLSSCSIPGLDHAERLGPDEGELGLGIHGEPGAERFEIGKLRDIVAVMADRLAAAIDDSKTYALLINNLGSVSNLQMGAITGDVLNSHLGEKVAMIVGPAALMTALDMNGFSLSLIPLDADREAALGADVGPGAWPGAFRRSAIEIRPAPASAETGADVPASDDQAVRALLTAVCDGLMSVEDELNRLDAKTGDGDTGSTVATGARSLLAAMDKLPLADRAATLVAIGRLLSTAMGGSSGVLLSIFFTAAGQSMASGSAMPAALLAGLDRMTFYGGAKPDDRTMIDALDPALKAFDSDGFAAAVAAARDGAQKTASITKAMAGRSAYVGSRDLEGVMDPGAMAVAEAFSAAAKALG